MWITLVLGLLGCLALAVLFARARKHQRSRGWRPVHPADDLVKEARGRPTAGTVLCQPESTPFSGGIVLLTIPHEGIRRRVAFCGDVGQAATTFYVQAYGREEDFTVTYEGSYQVSHATVEALKAKYLYLRAVDNAVILTDRELTHQADHQYLGHPDSFYYAQGLCAMLKWDPLMLNDGVVMPDGSEHLVDTLELFGTGRGAPPKKTTARRHLRLSDDVFEEEFRRVANDIQRRRRELSKLSGAIGKTLQTNSEPEPHKRSLRYPNRGAKEPQDMNESSKELRFEANAMDETNHLHIVQRGAGEWNRWRTNNPHIVPNLRRAPMQGLNLYMYDFSCADLTDARLKGSFLHSSKLIRAKLISADLTEVNLGNADLTGADLTEADLEASDISVGAVLNDAVLVNANLSDTEMIGANMSRTKLNGARLFEAKLAGANLAFADLSDARLDGADLSRAVLTGAKLAGAHLKSAVLTDANLEDANLTGAHVYGIAAWNVKLAGAIQLDLVITEEEEGQITVDNLEVAEFVHRLLHNEKIRGVIDTLTSKVVLILGRFTPERRAVLLGLKGALRRCGLVPILFDFEKPRSRTTLETVTTLAQISHGVIADLTDAKSVLQELQAIVPMHPSIPVQPLLLATEHEPGMIDFFKEYPWFLHIYRYVTPEDLERNVRNCVLEPIAEYLQRRGGNDGVQPKRPSR